MDTEETIPLNDGDVSGAAQTEQQPEASTETPDTAEESTRVEGPLSRRDQRMAEIAEKAKTEREAGRRAAALMNDPELTEEEYDAEIAARDSQGDAGEPESPKPDDAAVTADQEGQKASQAEAPATPTGWRTREDGVRVKTLKVNGEPVEITETDYDRYIQKDIAGDQKLRLASEMERKLREREQNLQRLESQLKTPPAQPGASDESVKKLAAEYHNALLDGDTDAADAKLLEMMQAGRQSSTPNIDEIASRVATQVERTQQQREQVSSMEEGWTKFKTDYPEIVGHDGRLAYADSIVKRLRVEKPNLKPGEVILEAGRIAAEELGIKKPEAAPPVVTQPGSTRDERMERKSKIRPLPQASGARHERKEAPQMDMSPSAKIARLRQSRVTG